LAPNIPCPDKAVQKSRGGGLSHGEWSSYGNLSGVLLIILITATEFLENGTDFVDKHLYILKRHSSKMVIVTFKKRV
jgi:hypothetical protein